MAPLFAVIDRPHYRKFIPRHLQDVAPMPPSVNMCFESGEFVCSISGKQVRCLALDEAHEILVKKDLKTTMHS